MSLPPYVAAGQPAVQFILHGSLPLASCGVTQSPAPGPPALPAASEPAAYGTGASNSEERAAAPRPAAEKAKNEEVSVGPLPHSGGWRRGCWPGGHPRARSQYMKKLQVQERAVEEVKLAIKPFYQKREVTKEEYKDILRKAVQKVGARGGSDAREEEAWVLVRGQDGAPVPCSAGERQEVRAHRSRGWESPSPRADLGPRALGPNLGPTATCLARGRALSRPARRPGRGMGRAPCL